MKRKLYKSLINWKLSNNRKPLILKGARQVGKTWLLKEFGRNEYDDVIYINCADDSFAKNLFIHDLKPKRIVRDIIAYTGQPVVEGKTLIIFDEIQEAPHGITSLKYFCENAPQLHVAVAGSLLGVIHHPGESYPVGKVDVLNLRPMTFEEFLWAQGREQLAQIISDCDWASMEALKTTIEDLLRQYYYVGGMPEAVSSWVSTEDIHNVRRIQQLIIDSYVNDISKHAGKEAERIRMVWSSIPSQLAKENKKFIYGAVKKGGRAKDFEIAIQWLVDAGLVHKLHNCKKPEMPLKFYEDFDAFKLYLLDVGLLGALSGASPAQMLVSNDVFKEFKGSFTENYVMQELMALSPYMSIFYYAKEKSTQEVDFLVQTKQGVIPIEVKAEENVKSKSLRQFVTIDQADKHMHGIRFSMKGHREQDWLTNVPLCCCGGFIAQKLLD